MAAFGGWTCCILSIGWFWLFCPWLNWFAYWAWRLCPYTGCFLISWDPINLYSQLRFWYSLVRNSSMCLTSSTCIIPAINTPHKLTAFVDFIPWRMCFFFSPSHTWHRTSCKFESNIQSPGIPKSASTNLFWAFHRAPSVHSLCAFPSAKQQHHTSQRRMMWIC